MNLFSATVVRLDTCSELAPMLWATLLVASKRPTVAENFRGVP